jgi:hypothetical protein
MSGIHEINFAAALIALTALTPDRSPAMRCLAFLYLCCHAGLQLAEPKDAILKKGEACRGATDFCGVLYGLLCGTYLTALCPHKLGGAHQTPGVSERRHLPNLQAEWNGSVPDWVHFCVFHYNFNSNAALQWRLHADVQSNGTHEKANSIADGVIVPGKTKKIFP